MRWLALIVVGCLAASALAAPEVQIKGKTRITLDRVRKLPSGEVEISGQLLDTLTGEGIGRELMTVKMQNAVMQTTTGTDGRFSTRLYGVNGPVVVEVEFGGAPFIDATTLAETVDPTRSEVVLVLRADPSPTGVKLTPTATVDDKPALLPVQLSIGLPADDKLAPLATLQTDQSFDLTRAAAAGTGSRRIRATFAGDASRQAAATDITLELTAATTTQMTLSGTDLAYEDELVVTGKVLDEDGKPVARAAITLSAGDRRLAQAATTEAGTYRLEIEAEVLGAGDWGLQVSADPSTSFLRPSRANPATIHVAAPQPVPVSYTIAAFVATALAAAGFFIARAKPWLRFRKSGTAAEAPEGAGEGDHTAGGLVTNKPSIVSTLRRASDDGFSGAVRDTVRARPVAGAVVRLVLGDDVRETEALADGTFTFEKLAVGEWRAEVLAPGHITEKFGVTIPHRGELRGVRVDLVPVRERVFQLYRRVAEPTLPEARLWGIWSPRQIVDHVRAKQPSPALAELTDFVEEIYFSPRVAPETVLPSASERVDRAIHERRPRPPN